MGKIKDLVERIKARKAVQEVPQNQPALPVNEAQPEPVNQELPEPQPVADTIQVFDKPGRFEILTADAKGQVLEARTVEKDTFKYRVLKPLELHGHSYQPGDVLECTVDDAHWLLQDGTVQTTCYWAASDDFSSEGYRQAG